LFRKVLYYLARNGLEINLEGSSNGNLEWTLEGNLNFIVFVADLVLE